MSRIGWVRNTVILPLILAVALLANASVLAQDPDQEDFQVTPLTPESIFHRDTFKRAAGQDGDKRAASQGGNKLVSVIVELEDERTINPFAARALRDIPSAKVTHRFDQVLVGVSLVIPEPELPKVAAAPGVVAVYRDQLHQLHTERSPQFLGADQLWEQLGGQGSAGEGVIVGVIDTGIWPEHPSFSDPDPSGKPYPAPPAKWTGTACEFGSTVPGDASFTCNNKLIGAARFMATYDAVIPLLPEEFRSARDDFGHGTHTSSTVAGNGGVSATLLGIPRGQVSGIAPRAHVAMYKACGDVGCFFSDLVAAINQAVADGVDLINYSISGGGNPYSDVASLAFLDAYAAGVFVAASAGNSGPAADTVDHREPWTTTVGASTTDRHFLSSINLAAANGDTLTLTGASVTDGIGAPTPVVLAVDFGDELCLKPFPAGTFSGKIVICRRGVNPRVEKSFNVAAGGAGGMFLYNPTLQGLATDNHFVPSVHLEVGEGAALLKFMATHTGETATFTPGTARRVQGDVMAAFSSRGGPGQTLGISKPDVTAPAIQILAGHSPLPATVVGGLPGQLFQAIQGTSMSAPHVAGAAALLKDLHPNWTPGQIKSALMLTALTEGVVKEDGVTPGGPFDFGSGRIDLSTAGNAGLTIDETAANYRALQHQLFNANYPSLYVPVMPGAITVQRLVHDETGKPGNWQLEVSAPADVDITVPPHVMVPGNGSASFRITIDARNVPIGGLRHATLELRQGQDRLHLPITIVRRQPAVTLVKTCDPSTIAEKETTNCTITISNTSFDDATVSLTDQLPEELELVPGSVVGATEAGNGLTFSGTLFGAAPPIVTVAAGASPGGYIPLSSFDVPPISGVGDETIVNFSVPPFQYAGETWTSIGMVSNGYLVVGGGTAADIAFINQDFPDPSPPNNVLAPFWTDLNPGAGGALRAAILTDGVNSWLVFDWEKVPNFTDGSPNSFQVWIGINGVEDISFPYGPDLSNGDGGFLTVGAENKFGNSGANFYFNGAGTLPPPPPPDDAVRVMSTPGAPGETHVITFSAEAEEEGPWQNCAEMTGDIFFGSNIACFSGQVTDDG